MNQQEQETRWLGWIEDELDQRDQSAVEDEMQADPELASRLHAMKRDRQGVAMLDEPESPSDLLAQVEREIARPMLSTSGQPGHYRRRQHLGTFHRRVRQGLPMAAMILVVFGLFAVLLLVNPFDGLFRSTPGTASAPPVAGDQPALFIAEEQPADVDDGAVVPEPVVASVAVEPSPLALILPPIEHEQAKSLLRALALRTNATLLRNASPADLDDPSLEASETVSRPGSPSLGDEDRVLLGDIDATPSIRDQFTFAKSGATWTVTIPLHELDGFLATLDEITEQDATLILLADHLDENAAGSSWMQAMRARDQLVLWRQGDADAMVVVPVFIKSD